jgi:hypothetical protein
LVTGIAGKTVPEMTDGLDASGITFHPSDQAGVLISKPGSHIVTLFDMAGHKVKELRGSRVPVDYNLGGELKGARTGIYVLRVNVAGAVRTKRFFIH